jgi:large subunit ribosomal protein L23
VNVVLQKPVITEKSMKQTESGLYTFMVEKRFKKPEIIKAVADKFKVDVIGIKTINVKDRVRLQRSRKGFFTQSGYKKAMILLKAGQKIALFEKAVAPEEDVVVTSAEGEPVMEVKEKKGLLRRSKVKIEKVAKEKK